MISCVFYMYFSTYDISTHSYFILLPVKFSVCYYCNCMHTRYAKGIFEFYIIMYAYHTQKWGNFNSDMLQHVPALLYKIYLVNERMNLCTMWYVTCCNNVEIHTTGFLIGFLQVFYWFFTLVNQLVSIQVFW